MKAEYEMIICSALAGFVIDKEEGLKAARAIARRLKKAGLEICEDESVSSR